jgi:hypothetical protein
MDRNKALDPVLDFFYPLVNVYKKLLNMAIEIVDLPIKNGGFP